jgi:glucosamine--fructose-6-phosphate aminotransferase (isomerizing)
VQFPNDEEIVALTPEGAASSRATGYRSPRAIELDWDDEGAEKGGFETFMLKEIYEQPEAVAETIGDRVRHGHLVLEGSAWTTRSSGPAPDRDPRLRHRVPRVRRRPVRHRGVGARAGRADIASEWIYRNPVIDGARS